MIIWIFVIIIVIIAISYGYSSIEEITDGIKGLQNLFQSNDVQVGIELGSVLVERGIEGIEHLQNNAEKMAQEP